MNKSKLSASHLIDKRLDEILPAGWSHDSAFTNLWVAAVMNGLQGKLLIIRRSDTQQGREFRLEWR